MQRPPIGYFTFDLPRSAIYVLAALVLLSAGAFSVFYLNSSHAELSDWYLGLNDCIYDREGWRTRFFTPAVKQQGNNWCLLALGVCAAGLVYLWFRFRRRSRPYHFSVRYDRGDRWLPVGLIVCCTVFWWWGDRIVAPAYDEVFSAVHAAGMHAFQTMSYYMLPNNHLLFNLVNGLFFGWMGDLVLTGRVLSLLAYMLIIACAYGWFRRQGMRSSFAALVSAVIALQFPVWGFAFQARGYEWYALAQWVVFISLFGFQATRNPAWLLSHTLATVAGYALVPTFLYFHAAVLVFALLYQVLQRRFDARFWRYQMLAGIGVFLFYLPLLCFSGFDAVAANDYVTPAEVAIGTYLNEAWPVLKHYVTYCFSNVLLGGLPIGGLLLLLPLTLFRGQPRARYFRYALFFVVMIVAFLLIMFLMRRYPFHRNLIGQFSLALTLVLFSWHVLLRRLARHFEQRWIHLIGLPALALWLGVNFLLSNPQRFSEELYYYDINAEYAAVRSAIYNLTAGSEAGLTDGAFYWEYLLAQSGHHVQRCSSNNLDYWIQAAGQPPPGPGWEMREAVLDYHLFQRQE